MKRLKENSFSAKFRLLNSQENVEEINWSSSELSENETDKDRFTNLTNKVHRKRKRKKVSKAFSNLDTLNITIVDAPHEPNSSSCVEISPIICAKTEKRRSVISPILNSPPYFLSSGVCETKTSPAIINADLHLKQSPIILQKHASPGQAKKLKKKLFASEETTNVNKLSKDTTGRRSPILETKPLTKKKIIILNENLTNAASSVTNKKTYTLPIIDLSKDEKVKPLEPIHIVKHLHLQEQSTQTEGNSCDDSIMMIKTNNTLKIEKTAKLYFDSHFSSESASQISINEIQTPKEIETEVCDEIEILSSLTQATKSNNNSLLLIKTGTISPSVGSIESDLNEEENKKPQYKKNGLAYRLNKLIKKQNASTLLWQHERFLAQNSNFIVPKASHAVFRICKINFKYGCYILETMDEKDERFFIIINSANISNCSLSENAIFKLYEPYSVLEYDRNQRLIMGTCKFECFTI